MNPERFQSILPGTGKTWLVTGAAGFIGSHLIEHLLCLDQRVIAVDNFSTGTRENLDAVRNAVGAAQYDRNCSFVEGDIRRIEVCHAVCENVDYVLHQAALGRVSCSLQHPLEAHDTNLNAMLNLMWASLQSGVRRFVYASSSAVYGDLEQLPHRECRTGKPLSPYAVGKYAAELYARNFHDCYQLQSIGLRYFNIFGPRQSAEGAYAAVIPAFVREILAGRHVQIFGDGLSSRDFCFVDDVVQANLLAATSDAANCFGEVFNVSSGEQVSIAGLYQAIRNLFRQHCPQIEPGEPVYRDFRRGEVRHSRGDISLIQDKLGFTPGGSLQQGLSQTLQWHLEQRATDRVA